MSNDKLPRRPLNRGTLGLLGTVAVLAAVVAVLVLPSLPFVRGGDRYEALFSEAGGLQSGDAVVISGQSVGKVEGLTIEGGLANVEFTVDSGVTLGQTTRAEVKVQTLLGRKALALTPAGPGEMKDGDTIPVERTVPPFDVTQALDDLTRTGAQIDDPRLGQAMNAVADTLDAGSAPLGPTLTGLDRLSTTIASRDQALRELLGRAQRVTGILADRNQQVTTLINDGNLLFRELQQRFATIQQLLISTTTVSEQISALIDENTGQTGPALTELQGVLDLLNRNRDNLARTLQEAGPFLRILGDVPSSGPFFGIYVQNLVPYDLKPQLLQSLLPPARSPGPPGGLVPPAPSGGLPGGLLPSAPSPGVLGGPR